MLSMARREFEDCEVTFVEESMSDHHECLVCLQLMREPWIIECCGHHMCKSCVDKVIYDTNECPYCRSVGIKCMRDRHLERILMGKQVYCKYKDRGCEWQGTLRESDEHCLTGHSCEWCHMILKCYEEIQHMEECAVASEVITCEIERFGCSERVPRMNMNSHMERNHRKHVDLLKEAIEKSTAEVAKLHDDNAQLKVEKERIYTEKETEFVMLISQCENKLLEAKHDISQLWEQICEQKDTEIIELKTRLESYIQTTLDDTEVSNTGHNAVNDQLLVATLLDKAHQLNVEKVSLQDNVKQLEGEIKSLQDRVKLKWYYAAAGVIIGICFTLDVVVFGGVITRFCFVFCIVIIASILVQRQSQS